LSDSQLLISIHDKARNACEKTVNNRINHDLISKCLSRIEQRAVDIHCCIDKHRAEETPVQQPLRQDAFSPCKMQKPGHNDRACVIFYVPGALSFLSDLK